MKGRHLIVTADDYGLTPEVSRGIRESISNGIVSCTSVLMNYVSENDLNLLVDLKRGENFGIGLHLNLTEGISLTRDAEFKNIWLNDPIFLKEEMLQQKDNFMDLVGEIDHVNFHHHVHYDLRVLESFLSIGEFRDIPTRAVNNLMHQVLTSHFIKTPDSFINVFPLGAPLSSFKNCLDLSLKSLITNDIYITEWMVHPGYSDKKLENIAPSYSKRREAELRLLCEIELFESLEINEIHCQSFKQVLSGKKQD